MSVVLEGKDATVIRQTNSDRLPGLDLLRAIAIIWVIVFHARTLFKWPLPPIVDEIAPHGWMGVDLFFVLSGYLIGTQLLKPYANGQVPSMARFYVNRALRILPAYIVVLVLYYAIPTFRERPGISAWWHFSTFTLNYLIDYEHNKAFSHAWSLCVEEHFYLTLPFIIAALMWKPSFRKTTCVVIGLLFLGMALREHFWHQVGLSGSAYVEKIYYPTHARFEGLLVGVLIASIKVFRPEWWLALQARSNLVLLAGIGLFALAFFIFAPNRLGYGASVYGFTVLAFAFGFIVLAGAGVQSVLGGTRVPGAEVVASLAYSTYLVHKQMISWDQNHLTSLLNANSFTGLVILLLSSLLAGALLYVGVERPFLRLRDRLLAKQASTA